MECAAQLSQELLTVGLRNPSRLNSHASSYQCSDSATTNANWPNSKSTSDFLQYYCPVSLQFTLYIRDQRDWHLFWKIAVIKLPKHMSQRKNYEALQEEVAGNFPDWYTVTNILCNSLPRAGGIPSYQGFKIDFCR